ncbi:phosphate starvation-inducible protein PsiF [Nitrogeniibacter mangrovi]|uniref:Phosphate starvation-inducible protein PsiF n=1 Tax=Nitrogeniibacter mangrovi TaxID=2016596 RepID=A0A6C1AYQ7_9RHOO|nr:PsiF family protein [Nitrogeniibacter mangrovi]QID16501.1 phosphate starvation-inducible protein PsiF [Nitrogeniibacter mangrovi]
MRLSTSLAALTLILSATSVVAAENPQHERMRNCNKTAKVKALKGDARKAFMKSCLSGKHHATGTPAKASPKPAKNAS